MLPAYNSGMNRRRFLFLSGGLCSWLPAGLPGLVAGCSSPPLRLACHPWVGYESLFIAREFGWLPPTVSLSGTPNASETLAQLKAGVVDGGGLTLDEVLRARSDGMPLAVVAVLDVSAGADMVLARPGVRSVRGLAGRRIAVERSALGEFLLFRMLQSAGMRRADVVVIDKPVDEHASLWRAGEIDAAITYDPAASTLIQLGGQRIFDSRQLPDSIIDVLALRRDRMVALRPQVRATLAAHFKALEHLRTNPQDAQYRIAARQNTSAAAVAQALAGVTIPDLPRNRRLLAADSGIQRVAREIAQIMVDQGIVAALPPLMELLDDTCLPEATPA